jgi:predicted transcriptional regulator
MGAKRQMTTAEYVRWVRRRLGLSQRALAAKLHWTQGTITHLETGRIKRLHPVMRDELRRLLREAK